MENIASLKHRIVKKKQTSPTPTPRPTFGNLLRVLWACSFGKTSSLCPRCILATAETWYRAPSQVNCFCWMICVQCPSRSKGCKSLRQMNYWLKSNKKRSFLQVISLCADVLHGLQPPTQVARICLLLSYFSVQFWETPKTLCSVCHWKVSSEAQKVWTFWMATFSTQKLSRRSE